MKSPKVLALFCLILLCWMSLSIPVLAQSLTVSASVSPQQTSSNRPVNVSVSYSASAPSTGLGVRLHWDSGALAFSGVSNVFANALLQVGSPQADGGDFDGNASTDTFVNISWVSLAGGWPTAAGVGTSATLFNAGFVTRANFSGSPLGVSFSGTPVGFIAQALGAQVASNEINLSIEKSAPSAINLGSILDYTIMVRNLGPLAGSQIPVIDTFPEDVSQCTWRCNPSPTASCAATGVGDIDTLVTIPVGGSVGFRASCEVNATARALFSNTARVGVPPGLVDPDLSNNLATAEVVVTVSQLQLLPSVVLLPSGQLGSPYQNEFRVLGGTPPYSVSSATLPPGLSLLPLTNSSGLVQEERVSLEGIPAQAGAFQIPLVVTDAAGNQVSRNYLLNITGEALALTPAQLPPGGVASPYQVNFAATGGVGPLSLTLSGEVPGLTVDTSTAGLSLVGIPTTEGTYLLTVTVTDAGSTLEPLVRDYTLVIQGVADMTLRPLASRLPEAVVGVAYRASITASGGIPPYTLEVQGTVPGLSATLSNNGLDVAGVPTEEGEYTLSATAIDSRGEVVNRSYSLVVVSDRSPLALLPEQTTLLAPVSEEFLSVFEAIGGVPPYVFNLAGVVPGLMASSTSDGTLSLSGTPSEIGAFPVTVTVLDSDDPPSGLSRDYEVRVGGDILLIPRRLPMAQLGREYLVSFELLNGVSPQQFTLVGDAPPGLSLQDNDLFGIPSQPGTYTVVIEAVDARGNTGARSYSLVVNEGLVIAEALPDAVVGASYSEQFLLFGGEAPIDWFLNEALSELPDGLALQNTGFLVGVPQEPGAFVVNVTATDNRGVEATENVTLQVLPTGIVDLSDEPPPGLVGEFYEFPILLTGGNPPYNCILDGGTLPPGLELTGCESTIEGIPSESGSFDFTVLARDSSQPPLSLSITQTINIAADTPIPQGVPPVVDSDATVQVPIEDISRDAPPEGGFEDEALQQAAGDAFGNRLLVGFAWRDDNYDTYVLGLDRFNQLFRQQRIDLGAQDFGYGVAASPLDQSIYVSGFSFVAAEFEAFLVKLDPAGVIQWQRTNTTGPQGTVFYDVVADATGVVVVGERYNDEGNFDASITRYDHDGNLLWDRVRASGDTESAFRVDVEPCPDPNADTACGIVVAGTTGEGLSRGWIWRLNPVNGAVVNGADLNDTGVLGMALGAEGDIIVGGLSAQGLWQVERLSPLLQRRWVSSYPAQGLLRSVAVDQEDNILAVGRISEAGDDDGLLVILGPDGGLLDAFRYSQGQQERFTDVVVSPSGDVSVAGGQRDDEGGRFLLLDVETGKGF